MPTPPAALPPPGRLHLAVALLLAALLLAHAALLPAAEWQGDEYVVLPGLSLGGWRGLLHRLVGWSPRPVAETLYAAYGHAVAWTGRPCIALALGLLWIGTGLAGAAWWRGAGPGRRARQLVTVALFAAFLLGHGVSEVFYWPAGATAYLVALAALTLLLTALLRGHAPSDWLPVGALLVLTGSCEIGAMFTLAFGALTVPLGAGRAGRWLRWSLPLLLATGVLVLLARGRVGGAEALAPGSATLHHGIASLRAALEPFWSGVLGAVEGAPVDIHPVAARLLLLVGLRWCLAGAALPPLARHPLTAFAMAALAAAGGSVMAAYFQFGMLCCQRHDTLRQCLFVLALAALAALSLRVLPMRGRHAAWARSLAPLVLLLAFAPAAVPRLDDLRHDLPWVSAAAAARAATWRSARTPDEVMAFHLPPPLRLVDRPFLVPGGYDAADPRWYVTGVLRFFGKRAMRVLPPPG